MDAPPPPRWSRTPGWLHRVLGDDLLLLGPGEEPLAAGGMAVPVWLVLEEPGTLDEVVARLERRWPGRRASGADVEAALDRLAEHGVIEAPEAGIVRYWGVAEDGGLLEAVVARSLEDELLRRWPLLGLERRTDRPASPERAGARIGLGDTGLFVPDDVRLVGQHPDEATWGVMEQTLTAFAVQRLTHLVAVHSAVIAWRGSVALVPATSGAGKSTLTVAAHEAGATVLSDEFALVDPATGLVTGWARPVRIRADDGSEHRLDLAVPSAPLPVGLIAALTYEPGAAASWTTTSASDGVLQLLANTVCAKTRPDASLDAALAVARGAKVVTGRRGEAADTVPRLLALLEATDDGEPASVDG